MTASDDNETSFNPRRKLCPDGSCVGIIGSDGKCTVCGQPAPGGEPPNDSTSDRNSQNDDATDDASNDEVGSDETAENAAGFDATRRLCGDDTCIGVIGPDNRCTECGKPAEG